MVSLAHAPVVTAPHYAATGDGTCFHRYLDDNFVESFLQDLSAGSLKSQTEEAFYREDCFSDDPGVPTLRLPIHRTFYMVCCEAACDVPGTPAFAPEKVRAAGFVVRREKDDARFLTRQGKGMGWFTGAAQHANRVLSERRINRFFPRPKPDLALPEEETHPLRATLLRPKTQDRTSLRQHTFLSGYLPLGGNYVPQVSVFDDDPGAVGSELPWPFGTAGREGNETFAAGDGVVVRNGVPNEAFVGLLALLAYRYGYASNPGAVDALGELFEGLHFVEETAVVVALFLDIEQARMFGGTFVPRSDSEREFYAALPEVDVDLEFFEGGAYRGELQRLGKPWPPLKGESVKSFLGRVFAAGSASDEGPPVVDWLAAAAGMPTSFDDNVRPLRDGKPMGAARLEVSAKTAKDLRTALIARWREELTRRTADLPLPRYGSEPGEHYYILPFVEHVDECGNSRRVWGPRSRPFRIASPFDPEAARPHLVQLPSLKDLRRGMAKGASFLAPADLSRKLFSMSPEMPPVPRIWAPHLGMRWIWSLSIPIVTFCAFLCLMIIVHILDLIFRWLPWVVVRTPVRD